MSQSLRVVVTGSTGRLGEEVMREFDAAGLACTGVDANATVEFRSDGRFVHRRADLTDFGQTVDALGDSDVVVHLANISYPGFQPDHVTFTQNVGMNYNVFSAASALKLRRVVWISTANVAGIDSGTHIPERFPITEDQKPRPSSAYALSKSVSEASAEYFGSSTDTSYIGVRSMLVVYPDGHAQLKRDAKDVELRAWHYWSYIDVRDLTRLLLLATTSDDDATAVVNGTAADSTLDGCTADHCARYFPDTPCEIAANTTQSLFSGARAKQLFGFEPQYSWRR